MQTTLLTLAIAVILALLAALLGPHFVDWNAQRGKFEAQATALIGVPVRVAGKMDVRLLPSPSLVLGDVEIGKPGDAQTLRAKALGIEFALPALLSGKLHAVELKLIAPELRLSLDSDGRAVLPRALTGVKTEALSIDKLQVEDAGIEMSDAASGAKLALGKLWFNGEVRALPGPFRGEGAFVMDGALYGYRISSARPEPSGSRIKFTLEPSDRPLYAEADGLMTAEGGIPRFEGQATMARRNMAVKGDRAPVPDPWKLTARVKANAAAALFEQVEFQYGPEDRSLKVAGTAEAKFGAQPKLDAVLSARQFDADKLMVVPDGQKSSPRAMISGLLAAIGDAARPPIPTQIGFGFDTLTLGGAPLQDVRGDLEIAAGSASLTAFEARAPGFTRVQATGRIDLDGERTTFTGPIEFSSVDPRAFSEWLDGKASASSLPARPLKLRGDITVGAGRLEVDRMKAEYDRNAFDGRVAYAAAQDGKRARLEATLQADELDLDAWLGLFGASLSDVSRPQDVMLALRLGRLRVAGFDAGKADIAINANSSGIAIERFSVGDAQNAMLDAKGRIDLKQDVQGGVSFDLTLRDAAAMRLLVERFAPAWAENAQRSLPSMLPARLNGRIDIEPDAKGASRLTFVAKGPLGPGRLDLTSSLVGAWNAPAAANVALKASLEASDVNPLLRLVLADRAAPVAAQPGLFTLSLSGKPDTEARVDTRLSSASIDLRATGNIRSMFSEDRSGALDLVVGPSPQTQPRLVWPGGPNGGIPVALKSALKFDPAGMRFDNLQASIAGSAVTGRLGIGFGRPVLLDGDLKAETLDLPILLAAATGLGAPNVNANWTETPFATSAWPSMLGAVSISAPRATLFAATRAANLRAGLRFTGNDVAAEEIHAELFGGRLSGETVIRRGSEGLGLSGKLELRDADASQILAPENATALSGRLALQMQFEGSGLSPRALVGSLNGSGKLSLEKASITALDPKAFAAAMRSVDQGLPLEVSRIQEVVLRSLEKGPLLLRNAEAQLSMAAGTVRVEAFTAAAEGSELLASGSYNLADSVLDTRFTLRGLVTAGGTQRPELALQLRGPALAPQKTIDVSALTGWLALRSVDLQTKRIEAIEQGRPAEAALQNPSVEPEVETSQPGSAAPPPAVPRKRPVPQAAVPVAPQQAPRVQPPAEAPRPRVPPRVESAPAKPVETQANPFPKPIGAPPPAPPPQAPGFRFNPAF